MKDFYSYAFADHIVYQTPTLWQTYRNYNYIVAQGNQAIVIDPGEQGPIQATIEANQLSVQGIYLTHHHKDHVGATQALRKLWNCKVFGFCKDQNRLPLLSNTFDENEELEILGQKARVLFLPGHTLGLCAFYFPEKELLFSNDLLFSIGCGRVFEGSMAQMQASLAKVRQLPDTTLVFCSHEYTEQNLLFARSLFPNDDPLLQAEQQIQAKLQQGQPTVPTSLGFEKKCNPFLRWDDHRLRQSLGLEDAEDWQVFAELRRLKDLP